MSVRSYIAIASIVAGLGTAGYALWQVWPGLTGIVNITVPAVTSGPVVRLAVVGDNHGATETYRQILDEIEAKHPQAILNLADTSEDGTVAEFQAVHQLEANYATPVIHVVGSHDIKDDPTRQTFITAFGHQPCSSVDVDFVRIVLLDNADRKTGFSPACLAWLQTTLATSAHKTILLAYHRPFDLPLGDVLGDDETSASRATDTAFTSIVTKAANVQYIFTAHLHTYLAYSFHGIPAVVSGGGGAPAQLVLGGAAHNYFHYLIVTIRGQQVTVDVHRVQLRG